MARACSYHHHYDTIVIIIQTALGDYSEKNGSIFLPTYLCHAKDGYEPKCHIQVIPGVLQMMRCVSNVYILPISCLDMISLNVSTVVYLVPIYLIYTYWEFCPVLAHSVAELHHFNI